MKLIRIVASSAVLLVALCILAVFLFALFMDPNRLKPMIAETLQQETGYDVVVDGPCSWSFYPYPGITVAHIAFSAPANTTPFVDLHKVTFVTQLTALLHGRLGYSHFYVNDGRLFDISVEHAYIGMHWQNKQLLLKPITAKLYGGTLQGSVYGNLSALPHWAVLMHASHVALQPLLQDVNGRDSKVSVLGQGDISIQVTSQGKSREQILNGLEGKASFQVVEGALLGIDLNALVSDAAAIIAQHPAELTVPSSQTVFDHFTGTFQIHHGVATTNDATLLAPTFTVHSNGEVSLIADTIALQLRVILKQDTHSRLAIPVTIAGSLANPVIRLDATLLNVELAKQKLGSVIDRVRDQVQHAPDNLSHVLQSLGK